MNTEYKVKLDVFEGPLDLLLHLINRLEIDIYDIPMAEITDQYMNYINAMQELKLDVASEYLVMAATLLAIKSRTLLPKNEEIFNDENYDYEEELDPREELIARLVEYRKYKEAAVDFKQLEKERNLIFSKPPSDLSKYSTEIEQPLNLNVNVYDMIGAYHKLLRRKRLQSPLTTTVKRQEISIEDRMTEITAQLRGLQKKVSFFDLFPVMEKQYVVVTFLAILELMKRNEIIVEQVDNFADIFIEARSGVEYYER